MAQGPWSNVPNVLQDILAQKRVAQQQRLMNELAVAEQQAKMEDAAKQQEHQRKVLEAQAAENAATAAYRSRQLGQQVSEGAAERASREKIAAMPVREQPESEAFTVGPTGKITMSVHPVTGKPIMTRAADPRMELGFPPQAPASAQQSHYQIPSPTTGKVESHWLRPGETPDFTPTSKTRMGGLVVRKGNEPVEKTTQVPTGLATKLATAKGAIEGSKGWWNPKGTAKTRAEYDILVQQAVSYAKSPKVKQFTRQILGDPDTEGRSTEEIVTSYEPELSPDELNELRDVLSGARGQ